MKACYFYFTAWPGATARLPLDAERVYTGPGTGDYFRAFKARWNTGEHLACIEQDVAVHESVLPQFAACPQPWCAFGWQVGPGQHSTWWLGCTRFSRQLQEDLDLSGIRGHTADICMGCTEFTPCHRHLDVILTAVGEHLGDEKPHVHYPDIAHLRA